MTTSYHFSHALMCYDADKYEVTTTYSDGASCRVWANGEDAKHALILGISAGEHKLLHELTHMQLAFAMGKDTCPIIRAQALLQPMPENAKELEDMIMALSYLALKKPLLHASWEHTLNTVKQYADPSELANKIYSLFKDGEKI